MKGLVETAKVFQECVVFDPDIVKTLQHRLSQPVSKRDSRGKTQLAVMSVFKTCRTLIDSIDDHLKYSGLLNLVHKSYEFLETSDLLKGDGIKFDHLTVLEEIYHFIANSVKKGHRKPILPVVTLLQYALRQIISDPERPKQQNDRLMAISNAMFARLFNLGVRGFDEEHFDNLELVLESIPFKSMADEQSVWAERLQRVIRTVSVADLKANTPIFLCRAVVKVIGKCHGVSMRDIFIVNQEFVKAAVQISDHYDDLLLKADDMDSSWKKFLDASCFADHAAKIGSILRVQLLLRIFEWTCCTSSAYVAQAMKLNWQTKNATLSSTNDGPVKLNFNSENDEELFKEPAKPLLHELFSRKDERLLLAPVCQAFELLKMNFDPNDGTTSSVIIEEVLSSLFCCIDIFYLRRMTYWELDGAQLAWKLVAAHESTVNKGTVLSVGTAYMRALRNFRLYNAGIEVVELIYTSVEEERHSFPLEDGLFAAESAWLLLLTHQIPVAKSALNNLKFIYEGDGCTDDVGKSLLRAQYFRLLAHLCFVQSENASTSPFVLLDRAKTEVYAILTHRSIEKYWGVASSLYLSICADLAKAFLKIGGPAEASTYVRIALTHAKQLCSVRWIMIFTSLLVHCYHGQGDLSECRIALCQLDNLLLGRNLAIFTRCLQKKKSQRPGGKTPPNQSFNALTEAASKLTLYDVQEESYESKNYSAVEIARVAEMPFLGNSHECKRGCVHEDCVDYDMHISLLESGFLKYRLLSEDKCSKRSIYRQCCDMYKPLKRKWSSVCDLMKKKPKDSDTPTTFLLAPMHMIRLWNVMIGFQTGKVASASTNSENSMSEICKQATTTLSVVLQCAEYPDYQILYPDLIALARYLKALCLLMNEASSVTRTSPLDELRKLISQRWCSSEQQDFHGVAQGEVIKDQLTAFFPKTPLSAKQQKQQIGCDPYTPDRGAVRLEFAPPEKVPKGSKLHVGQSFDHEEPEMTLEVVVHFQNQHRDMKVRRDAIFQAYVPPSQRRDVDTNGAVWNASKVSRSVNEAVEMLQSSLRSMSTFPLYPHYRMAALMLLLLTDERDGQGEMASLAAKSTVGKLHHLSFQHYHRMLRSDSATEEVTLGIKHLAFSDQPMTLDTDVLPMGWVVCSINCVTQLMLPLRAPSKPRQISHIAVTRWEHGVKPITMRVDVGASTEESLLLSNMSEILRKRDETPHRSVIAYWKHHLMLNGELSDMTTAMDLLLGHSKALLVAYPVEKQHREYLEDCVKKLKAIAVDCGAQVENHIFQILVMSCVLTLADSELTTLISSLLSSAKNALVVEKFHEVLKKFKTSTKKPHHALLQASRNPVILILDAEAHTLPWESTPTLRGQPVSRLPSVQYVNLHLSQYQLRLKRDRGFYILDPQSNLPEIQKDFKTFFLQPEMGRWDGVIGKAPSSEQVNNAFQSSEMIVYMGHGSGERFFRGPLQQNKWLTEASLMLVGCSSALMEYSSLRDASAFFLNCLIMGSKFIVGNLWVVTSSILPFTKRTLDPLFRDLENTREEGAATGLEEGESFHLLFARSRDKLISNYLTGASPVIIGLPRNWSQTYLVTVNMPRDLDMVTSISLLVSSTLRLYG